MRRGIQHIAHLSRLRPTEDRGDTGSVGEFTLDEVIQMGRDVQGLAEHRGWKIVKDLLDREIAAIQHDMTWNAPHDHMIYVEASGRLRGLQEAEAAIDSVLIAAEDADRARKDLAAQMELTRDE